MSSVVFTRQKYLVTYYYVDVRYCRCYLRVLDTYRYTDVSIPSGWAHLVCNYIGPNNDVKMYLNGAQEAGRSTTTSSPRSTAYLLSDGRIVLGRSSTNKDRNYAGVDVDEILLFNQSLTDSEVTEIANL